MNEDTVLREHLLQLLRGRNAHLTFDDAVADFPLDRINTRPPNVSYTPWHLVEHLRIAQWDIFEFVRRPDHVSPSWPEGYWPAPDEQADAAAWERSLAAFRADLGEIEQIVKDTDINLMDEIPHAPGYTYFREILLVADHNAYHVGEFAVLRQVTGTWPADRSP